MRAYLLNLADLFLTLHAIAHGGVELNPLMQSIPVMVAWKVAGVGVMCGVLEHYARPHEREGQAPPLHRCKMARAGLRFVTAVYAAVCIHHLFFIGGAF